MTIDPIIEKFASSFHDLLDPPYPFSDGNLWHVKQKEEYKVYNELAGSIFAKSCGLNTPEMKIFSHGSESLCATKYLEGIHRVPRPATNIKEAIKYKHCAGIFGIMCGWNEPCDVIYRENGELYLIDFEFLFLPPQDESIIDLGTYKDFTDYANKNILPLADAKPAISDLIASIPEFEKSLKECHYIEHEHQKRILNSLKTVRKNLRSSLKELGSYLDTCRSA